MAWKKPHAKHLGLIRMTVRAPPSPRSLKMGGRRGRALVYLCAAAAWLMLQQRQRGGGGGEGNETMGWASFLYLLAWLWLRVNSVKPHHGPQSSKTRRPIAANSAGEWCCFLLLFGGGFFSFFGVVLVGFMHHTLYASYILAAAAGRPHPISALAWPLCLLSTIFPFPCVVAPSQIPSARVCLLLFLHRRGRVAPLVTAASAAPTTHALIDERPDLIW